MKIQAKLNKSRSLSSYTINTEFIFTPYFYFRQRQKSLSMAFCFYMTPFFFSATSNNIGMVSLIDKNKKTVGYIYNNAIMHPTTFLLSGIILGGCVYNHHGIMIGKYFRNKMYNTAGEIAALTEFVTLKEDVDYAVLSYQVWQLIPKIHLVESKWIQPQSKWSAEPLSRLLQ